MTEDHLPGSFGVEAGALETFQSAALFPEEVSARGGANTQRKAAFRGGRACAHQALRQIGGPAVAIGTGTAGEPLWPAGCVGSISHTNKVVAAVVAFSPPVRGIGIDLEENEPLQDAAMVELVCRPDELILGSDPSQAANLQRGKLLFVIKEAVYKLCWPVMRTFLEFHDVSVMVDIPAGTFSAELVNRRLPAIAGHRLITGRFAEVRNLYVALAVSRF